MNWIKAAVGLLLLAAVAPNAQSPLRSREFEFDYLTRIPAMPRESGKLRIWIPVPQSDHFQDVKSIAIKSPYPYKFQQDPQYHNRYAYLELSAAEASKPLEIDMRIDVKRRENRVSLDARAPAHPEKDPAELARSLQRDQRVPLDGVIAKLAEEQTRGLTRPVDKARAIFNYVVSTMRYDKSGEGWGRGDAVWACTARRGNCTDFHALFIGMMRASGIPARFEIGFPLPRGQHGGEIPGYHCWAEFWLDDIGWVPVDASEAWKDPARRDYFFGAHDENRIQFTRGRDLRLKPPQDGEPMNYFVYPYAELDGKPLTGVGYKFSFRDVSSPGGD